MHIFTLLPQFHMTSFISKFVRLHGVLLFQNKQICLATYGPQCESLMSHERTRDPTDKYIYIYIHIRTRDPTDIYIYIYTYT